MALLLLRGCTEVDVFRAVVVVVDAAGLCSAMIVIFSVVNVCFEYPEIMVTMLRKKNVRCFSGFGFF
jgi:phosphosulfolactate phosphohydrolase-like enzyme